MYHLHAHSKYQLSTDDCRRDVERLRIFFFHNRVVDVQEQFLFFPLCFFVSVLDRLRQVPSQERVVW